MTTNIDMRLASTRINTTLQTDNVMPRLFTPGEVITSQQGFMRYVFRCFYCIAIAFNGVFFY